MKRLNKQLIRIISVSTLLFIAVYLLSAISLFCGYYVHQNQLFSAYEVTIIDAIGNSVDRIRLPYAENNPNITVDNLIPENCNVFGGTYPHAIALYNSDGKIVHTNVAVLSFQADGKNMYCYLDEYLKEEELQQIYDFLINSSGQCDKFEYYVTDEGKIAPASIGFSRYIFNPVNHKTTTERLDFKLETPQATKKPEAYSIEFEMFCLPKPDDYDAPAHTSGFLKSEKKIYDSLLEKLKSNTAKTFASRSLRKGYGIGNINNSSSGWDSIPVKIGDSEYAIVMSFAYNPVIKILSQTSFLFTLLLLFFICLGLAVIVAVFSVRNYNQKKQLEQAAVYFTSAAAHELKTPLAIMQNQCECLMENISPENNEKYQRNIFKEIQRMNKLVNGLLRYTKLNQTDHIKTEKNDLSAIVHNEIDKYYDLFEAHCHNIKTEICEDAFVECNNELIALVVDNFLSNAAKHSDDGSDIEIKLQRLNNGYEFSVYNKGAHIPKNVQQDIWSVLYKSDKARTSSASSGGMGLAICAKILELHSFKYGYKNVNDGVIFYFCSRSN